MPSNGQITMQVHSVKIVAVVLCFLAAVALAEVPLSHQQLATYAAHVFAGRVLNIEHKDIPNPRVEGWSNRHFKLNVNVTEVFRTTAHSHRDRTGDDETVRTNATVHVMLWKAHERPSTYKGPVGILGAVPAVGEERAFYTLYLHRDAARRSMYHESFPAVETDEVGENAQQVTIPAYNVLTPNGIGLVNDVPRSLFAAPHDEL